MAQGRSGDEKNKRVEREDGVCVHRKDRPRRGVMHVPVRVCRHPMHVPVRVCRHPYGGFRQTSPPPTRQNDVATRWCGLRSSTVYSLQHHSTTGARLMASLGTFEHFPAITSSSPSRPLSSNRVKHLLLYNAERNALVCSNPRGTNRVVRHSRRRIPSGARMSDFSRRLRRRCLVHTLPSPFRCMNMFP